MSITTIIFAVLIVIFAFRGYRSGIVTVIFRILSLLGAYLLTYLFTPSLGAVIEKNTELNGLVALIVAGIGIFVVSSLLLEVVFSTIKRLLPGENEKVSPLSSVAGATIGGLVGVVIGFVFVWAISLLNQILNQKAPELTGLETTARKLTSQVVRSALETATDQPELAGMTAALLAEPEEAIMRFQRLAQSPEFESLFRSHRNQEVLNSGDIERIKNLPALKRLINHPDFLAMSEDLGLTEGDVPLNEQVAYKVRDLWARAQFVKNDPETQSILQDPEFQSLMSGNNMLAILNNEKFTRLLERIMSSEAAEHGAQVIEKAKESKIYKWIDENGRVHYSDKKPDDA